MPGTRDSSCEAAGRGVHEQVSVQEVLGESSGQRTRPADAWPCRGRRLRRRRGLPGRAVPGRGRLPCRPWLPRLLWRPSPPRGRAGRPPAHPPGTYRAAASRVPAAALPASVARPGRRQPPVAAPGGRPARRRPPPATPLGQPPAAAGRESRPSPRARRHFYPERTVGSPRRPRCSPPWPALGWVLRSPHRRSVLRWSATGAARRPTRTGRPRIRARRAEARAGPRRRRDAVRSGLAGPGTASGPPRPRPVRAGLLRAGPVHAGPVRAGPLRAGPLRSGPARRGAVRTGTVRARTLWTGTIRTRGVRTRTARSWAVRSGSVRTRCRRSLRPGRAVLPRRRSVCRGRRLSV